MCDGIENGAPEDELRDLIRAQGTGGLLADGLSKVCEGVTTLQEVRSMTWVPFPVGA
jgi:type II secretory ATPase GspE/PulE/Tfp pilus assembly ATPase PilB-like protein